MFEHKVVHNSTWYQATLGQRLIIDFVVLTSDLRPYILDTLVKRAAELLTDHHLVVSWIRWRGRLPDRPGKPKGRISGSVGAALDRPDEEGAKPEDKMLDLPVHLYSNPLLWSLAVGHDRKDEITDTSS